VSQLYSNSNLNSQMQVPLAPVANLDPSAPPNVASRRSGAVMVGYRDWSDQGELVRRSLPRTSRAFDPAFKSQIRRLHRLGERPLGELLLAIMDRVDCKAWLRERIWQYAQIDPQLVESLNAADFPMCAEVLPIDGGKGRAA
jgi:hypothetical protein